jgi:hypothetical protein
LTRVGLRRTPAYLRDLLVNGPRQGSPEYVLIKAEAGTRRASGFRVAEDTFNLILRDSAGTTHSFRKNTLTDLRESAKSPMPAYGWLSRKGLDDTLAYLVSLQ